MLFEGRCALMDIFHAVYFSCFVEYYFSCINFGRSMQTEVGSAGKQPARDNIGDRRKMSIKGLSKNDNPFLI